MKKRVWELDAFRGLCILGMIVVHLVYALVDVYRLVDWNYPPWLRFVQNWGGILFFLLSGICATLGTRCVRRGLIVFACGLLVSAVTVALYRMGMANRGILIYFGVLHCLGVCMLVWPIFRRLPWWILACLGIVFVILGFVFDGMSSPCKLLMPLGIVWNYFATADFFPLFPNLGYFLLGGALGRTLYRRQQSLLPGLRADRGILKFLQACGRHSLWIYLLHQPILHGLCMILQAS